MANPFAGSRGYARLSNLFMLPLFSLLPVPRGFALLTVTGRRSGSRRQRPVRAVRRDQTLYAVAMMGESSDWLRNVRKEPQVEIKVGGERYGAMAREVSDAAEREAAIELYAREVFPADYSDYVGYHWGWPTRQKIEEAHRRWAAEGVMVAIEIDRPEGE
ncbi:MAG TPA: nitroreductase family deazaflavin-dependent oxidoreductase [Dehalococcoidia bacterium]|nr:nitroreductase family deazaflavin-dependent oxidoreductase [Dehalococcoidia bacterium]